MVPTTPSLPRFAFLTPRVLPPADQLAGRVAVLDIAFASDGGGASFEKTTLPFIRGLGSRLAAWVDHHDHDRHVDYASDSRFVLHTKAEHGACPEIITPEIVRAAGPVDTVAVHLDLDGLYSGAKWVLGGIEPYEGPASVMAPWVAGTSQRKTDAEVDRLYAAYNSELDEAKRKAIFADFQKRFYDQAIAVKAGNYGIFQVATARLKNFVPYRIPRMWGVWLDTEA